MKRWPKWTKGWRKVGILLILIYVSYLHYKIVLYKYMLRDYMVAELGGYLIYSPSSEKSKFQYEYLWERRLIDLWLSLDREDLRSHPGREAWKHRIEMALRKDGKRRELYPKELLEQINNGATEEPEVNSLYYRAWDYPGYNWWP